MKKSYCGLLLAIVMSCCFSGCGGVTQSDAKMEGTPPAGMTNEEGPNAGAPKKFTAPSE